MGIFQLKNKVNGRLLIEQSLDIPAKWNRIQSELKFGSHRNIELQKDWNKFETDDFEMTILSELEIKQNESVNPYQDLKTLMEMTLEEMDLDTSILY